MVLSCIKNYFQRDLLRRVSTQAHVFDWVPPLKSATATTTTMTKTTAVTNDPVLGSRNVTHTPKYRFRRSSGRRWDNRGSKRGEGEGRVARLTLVAGARRLGSHHLCSVGRRRRRRASEPPHVRWRRRQRRQQEFAKYRPARVSQGHQFQWWLPLVAFKYGPLKGVWTLGDDARHVVIVKYQGRTWHIERTVSAAMSSIESGSSRAQMPRDGPPGSAQRQPPNGPTGATRSDNDTSIGRDLIGVIDVGTRTVRFAIFRATHTTELYSRNKDIERVTPREGWNEQDPKNIHEAVEQCIFEVLEDMEKDELGPNNIATIGICNARETTLAWDSRTGDHLYNAILWSDIRTNSLVDYILAKFPVYNKNHLKPLCGLPVSSYFSALKIRWLIDNLPGVAGALREKRLMVGTLDTWLVWNLTGGSKDGIYVTDVTNASRTMLMNIEKLKWDSTLCRYFNIPKEILPEIKSSSEIYGYIKYGPLEGIPISGILGNQQAALVGQNCLQSGQTKNSYRSGCFLLCNTGIKPVFSEHGLETTVAYKLGPDQPAVYAIEGSVAVAGLAIKWLRDKMHMMDDIKHCEELAEQVFNTGDVYFVPAFHGLYAPHWRKDARGIICGITGFTTKDHIIRAALEAVCFQTKDILRAIEKDTNSQIEITKLYADGKLSQNTLLMQLQADIAGIPVYRSTVPEISTLGAAKAAGNAQGIDLWNLSSRDNVRVHEFIPKASTQERVERYRKWKMAVQRSLNWVSAKPVSGMTEEKYRILASIPASWFLMTSFILLRLSYYYDNR